MNNYKKLEDTVKNAIIKAEESSEMIIKKSYEEKDKIIQEAKQNASVIVNEALGKFVFSDEQMKTKPHIVDECLMMLPEEYLNIAEFSGVPPNELNEFVLRRKYVKFNRKKLSKEEKHKILMRCKQGILDDEEVDAIQREEILRDPEVVELCKRGLKTWKEQWKEQEQRNKECKS